MTLQNRYDNALISIKQCLRIIDGDDYKHLPEYNLMRIAHILHRVIQEDLEDKIYNGKDTDDGRSACY